MDLLEKIKHKLPNLAKELYLNFDSVICKSKLPKDDVMGIALAASFAAENKLLVSIFKEELTDQDYNAAINAALLMGMLNTWYEYIHMANDTDLNNEPARLRMNSYANHGFIDKNRYEQFALSASIIGKCRFCVSNHYKILIESGVDKEVLYNIGRIVSVIKSLSMCLKLL